MNGPEDINNFGAWITVIGFISWVLSAPTLWFIKEVDPGPAHSKSGLFRWNIGPALVANAFFEKFFGERGKGFRDLFTWRSVTVTLLFSGIANLLCVLLILTSSPEDAPPFELPMIRILFLNHVVFMTFNFLGDLVSVSVTRHILNKIATTQKDYLHYFSLDLLGIFFGYLVTLSPTFLAICYSLIFNYKFNELIHAGLLGNALMPFFLLIFSTTHIGIPLTIFSLLAVFSITIPTAFYLFLVFTINFGRLIYQRISSSKSHLITSLLSFGKIFGGWLMIGGGGLMALDVIIKGFYR